MFYCVNSIDIANYADDSTPYTYKDSLEDVIKSLELSTNKLFEWFKINSMKSNADKCHLLTKSDSPVTVNIGDTSIKSSNSEKLLGITIDSQLTFEPHINQMCTKASQKLNAISRISQFMNFDQRKLIVNAFLNSQFSYCPLTWMSHSRSLNNKINCLHERCLRLIYSDNRSSFQELLSKDDSVTIHQRNIQILATELYKVANNLSPELMKETFPMNNCDLHLRNDFLFKARNVKTVKYGTESADLLSS